MRYKTILMVEDDPPFRQVIARNLLARRHQVIEAATAAEALVLICDRRPDLLLLDINLPDQSGWELLRDLRTRNIAVPTVVVSAVHVSPTRLEEFQPLAYLPKPFPLDALVRIVENGMAREAEAPEP